MMALSARDRPISRDIEPLRPEHNPAQFPCTKCDMAFDVRLIVHALLQRERPPIGRRVEIFHCHSGIVDWIPSLPRYPTNPLVSIAVVLADLL